MLYKFPTHFKGIGQNEYLSQGRHNYNYCTDIVSEPARFSSGDRAIHLAKLGNGMNSAPVRIRKISNWIYTLTKDGKVWFVPDAPLPAVMNGSYDPYLCPSWIMVADTGVVWAQDLVVFHTRIYVFSQTQIHYLNTSVVNGFTSWGDFTLHPTTITASTNRPIVNFLDAKLYFGNDVKLGRIDEFNVVDTDVIERNFTTKIVGLTTTGSVLNVYTLWGHKNMMDLSSESISEVVDLKTVIVGVNSETSTDFLITQEGTYGQLADGSSLSYSSGYDKKEIVKSWVSRTLSVYDYFFVGLQAISKFTIDTVNPLIELYNWTVYTKVLDSYPTLMMFKNGAFSNIFAFDQYQNVVAEINCIYPNSDGVFMWFKTGTEQNWYYYIAQIGLVVTQGVGYSSRKSALVENVFTGGVISYEKAMKEIRFRADVPAGCRLILKAVFDKWVPETLATIAATTKKVHIYPVRREFFEMMLIWEMYNDITDCTNSEVYNKVCVYDEPEINYEIIRI